MKKLIVSLIVGCLASSAMATWMDDFESYPNSWTAIPTPWETSAGVVPLYIQPSGYLGSKGAGGPSGWNNSHQWRPVDGEATVIEVYGKMMDDSTLTGTSVALHLSGSKSITVDDAEMALVTSGATPALWLITWDYEDNVHVGHDLVQLPGLLADVWYDVRMTIRGSTVTGEYKAASNSTWITVGTVTTFSDFDDTYIGMRVDRAGWVDDVGYVPEPATIVLLLLGGLLIRRKKA